MIVTLDAVLKAEETGELEPSLSQSELIVSGILFSLADSYILVQYISQKKTFE